MFFENIFDSEYQIQMKKKSCLLCNYLNNLLNDL